MSNQNIEIIDLTLDDVEEVQMDVEVEVEPAVENVYSPELGYAYHPDDLQAQYDEWLANSWIHYMSYAVTVDDLTGSSDCCPF